MKPSDAMSRDEWDTPKERKRQHGESRKPQQTQKEQHKRRAEAAAVVARTRAPPPHANYNMAGSTRRLAAVGAHLLVVEMAERAGSGRKDL